MELFTGRIRVFLRKLCSICLHNFIFLRLSNPKDDKSKVNVSISLKFYQELQSHGAENVLQREYGDMLVAADEGFDVTVQVGHHHDDIDDNDVNDDIVQVDLSNIPDNWEEIVKKCGRLKRNCFAAVFEKYFEFQVSYLLIVQKHSLDINFIY